jgi:hypothetical protein
MSYAPGRALNRRAAQSEPEKNLFMKPPGD